MGGPVIDIPIWDINGFWDVNDEGPERFAVRYLYMLNTLSKIDPIFSNWIYAGSSDALPLGPLLKGNELAKFIESDGVVRDDDGEPEPANGYHLGAINDLALTPRSIDISITAGITQQLKILL